MPHLFIILLKINLVLILFAAAYYLILRRLTFYVINRVFLVFGIVFATIYPFIDLTEFFHQQTPQAIAFVPEINQKVKSLVATDLISNYWQLLSVLFYLGVAIMFFRLVLQFVSLYKMHKKSTPGAVANYSVRILKDNVSPFSFWQNVYINPNLHKEQELKTILAHEQIHVKEWHSLDIILAELSVVFYWFNPGVWLMKRAVKENLEFITDQKILSIGVDKKTYQYSLLDVGNLTPAVEIVNNFNLSDLKKRIKMMNAKRSSKVSLSRYLFVLPILLLTTLAFTVAKKEEFKAQFKPLKNALASVNILDTVVTSSAAINTTAAKDVKVKSVTKKLVKTNTDTSAFKNMHLVVKTVFSSLDSLDFTPSGTDKKITFSLKKHQPDAGIQLNGKTERNIIFLKTDSLSAMAALNERNEILKLLAQSKITEDEDKVAIGQNKVVITAYKANSKLEPFTDKDVSFYLNGKKITKEELGKVKANEIINVSVVKGEKGGEVRIIGKGTVVKD